MPQQFRFATFLRSAWGLWLLASLVSATAAAEEIRLKDGTTISARVLGKDRDSVAVGLPRAEIASINGQPLPPPVVAGSAAPAFEAVDLSGAPQSLAAGRGRVTLLQFWATWCPHCRSDLSLMKDLFARYREQGLRLLAVSIDQDAAKLQAFVTEQQIAYPVLPIKGASLSPEQAALPDRYEMRGVPTYYLINADGMIVETFSGSAVEGHRDLEGTLKPLLAALPSSSTPSSHPSSSGPARKRWGSFRRQ